MQKFGKLIDNKLEIAHNNYMGYLNFDKDKNLMREFGFKPVREISAPNYDPSYQELSYSWIDNGKEIIKIWEINEFKSKKEAEREKIANSSLSKREVFLAVYKAVGVSPEKIRELIKNPKALIEFDHAERYFRSNPLINNIGEFLGFSPEDLDELFRTGNFPENN